MEMSEESSNITPDNLIPTQSPPDSPRKPVKSTAVVKYSAAPSPATFAELQCNTDLNRPPINWLSSTAESYGFQSVWSPPRNRCFSSFRMAHMFPDCVGEVDVVSDSENIKKLLKISYTQGVISMVVHRVENTLLLDDFDVNKYLMRQVENEWKWLKKFVCEQFFQNLGDKEKRLTHKSTRTSIKQKNLNSKFLYHSLVLADNKEQNVKPTLPDKTLEPSLPEPSREEELPDPNCKHNFARNVLWTFENIQMLIGTDMPIFGGPAHPCISLRLKDMAKPISVLTGIDYWLDNLMSNVPEVVMCYHLDGFVQKYELIKTEDLPNMKDAKFSPKIIRDVAQSILSFLKLNVTKAGHTYWLFKGKDDDVVKLYDLTSLCSEVNDDKGQSPFTVPVAMLLYRVARNMKYSVEYCSRRGTIRMLLKNCIQLLTKEKYPQIITSAHYMLSDLYVPAGTDPANPILMEQEEEESPNESYSSQNNEDSEKMEEEDSGAIKSLFLSRIKEQPECEEFKYKPPPIVGTVEERCKTALEHVATGLECLTYFPMQEGSDEEQKSPEKEQKEEKEQNAVPETDVPQMAKPFQAIPMPYAPLNQPLEVSGNSPCYKKKNKQKKNKKYVKKILTNDTDEAPKTVLCKSKTLPTWQAPKKSDNRSWNAHLKTLLYEKASLILGVLAEKEYSSANYGAALRYISIVLRCQKILEVFCGINNEQMMGYFLGRAGDCGFMIFQNWNNVEKHKTDFETRNEISLLIDEICSMEELENIDLELLPQQFKSRETTLLDSLKCYNKAVKLQQSSEDQNALLRRVGNIHNELGVLYMNQASELELSLKEDTDPFFNEVTDLLKRSQSYLENGIKNFETVSDKSNLALLYSNMGRLLRTHAHFNFREEIVKRVFYESALLKYHKALQVLGDRKCNPGIWDNVTWEYSTTLYSLAAYVQDCLDYGQGGEKSEREAIEILQKALKYCETDISDKRQFLYQLRAATIHHRLATLYQKIYKDSEAETKKRTNLQLCKIYYSKAAKMFLSLEKVLDYLRVQMDQVAFAEFQASRTKAFNGKVNCFRNALDIILQCQEGLEILRKIRKNMKMEKEKESMKKKDDTSNNSQEKEATKLNDSQEKKEAKLINLQEKEDDNSKDSQEKNFNSNDSQDKEDSELNDLQMEHEKKLVALLTSLQEKLQYVLLSLAQLYSSDKSTKKHKQECDAFADLYKKCYKLSLKLSVKRSLSDTFQFGIKEFIEITKQIAELLK